ncbi:MAG: hypothetical protein KDK62_08590, partial [Chlamydiia bacterium]|nr:hypothetical protein [Chlamydiia bacterium]
MKGINSKIALDTLKSFIPNFARKTATEPETMRTEFKAGKYFSGLANNSRAAAFFGDADKGIKTAASVKVIPEIYENGFNWKKWKADGFLALVKKVINLANLVINPLMLVDSLGFASLGKAVKPLALVSTGLDVIERVVNFAETGLKMGYLFGGQGSKYVGHMQEKVTKYTTNDDTKAEKWQRRVIAFRMKQGEQFLNIAFYTSLLAMHILLGVSLLIPGVNVVVPLLIVVGIVTVVGLTKLAWSTATPENKERKFKHIEDDNKRSYAQNLRQLWNVTWSLGYKAPKGL